MELGRWLAAALAAALAAPAARKAREAALGPADLAWPRFRDGAEPALVALESAALAAAAARPRAGLAGGGEGGTEETRGLATTVLAVTLAAAAALASLVQILSLVRWRKTRGPGLRALGLWIAALRQDGLLVALEVVLAAIAIWRGEGSTREQFVKSPCADLPPAARSVPKGTKARIVMLAMGSRGDVQPFIALGKALESSGRVHVVIATMAKFQELSWQTSPKVGSLTNILALPMGFVKLAKAATSLSPWV
ncbi:Sterol 3-beta-glucosyltransferase [Hondaea fermentalgiana]|uniref:Sterol 3-beta-glucosyltransferase n=1 Tax=Hondaea fermentalgiana TaxID=2315210 RepID=A0A2R5GT24_9STRA|nr:Sterol 3-beta-glucosyltransferase [Hondaea fermentalgiana]|eukprot:GBG31803.1 Sterol 3-beta-glucosyltransferase [Hondaea fermentalgiana]